MLSLLSHPHIAQVYDAGVDEQGDPYLVVEYVAGETIVEHCDRLALSLEKRLALFLQVCAAVEHAHQRFVVHRDLKPSNILVDENGAAKLLDFGIAKLLDAGAGAPLPPLDATRTGLVPMTPEFAAPEQVRGGEITAATDVYALGVLLYELLAGERPYALQGRTAGEIERVVCEVEPPPPSRRSARLAADLDVITMKALRKEPAARYASAAALAEDVRRFLAGLPVEARPATATYRARKFVRRHRWATATAALVTLAAALFVVALLRERARTARERDAARLAAAQAQQVSEFVLGLFAANDPNETKGAAVPARALLDRGAARIEAMRGQPELQARMLDVLGTIYGKLGELDRSEALLRRAIGIDRARGAAVALAAAEEHLADVRHEQGGYQEAEALLRDVLAQRERSAGSDSVEVAASLTNLGSELADRGKLAQAEPLLRRALEIYARRRGEPLAVALTQVTLGDLFDASGHFAESEAMLRTGRASLLRALGPLDERVADADGKLAKVLVRRGRLDEAEALHREALATRQRLLGPESSLAAQSWNDLAVLLEARGDIDGELVAYRQALAIAEHVHGPQYAGVGIIAGNLAKALLLAGRPAEAAPLAETSVAVTGASLGETSPRFGRALLVRGMAHAAGGDVAAAETDLRRALAVIGAAVAADNPTVVDPLLELGRFLVAHGSGAEAEPLLARAHDLALRSLGADNVQTARAAVALAECRVLRGDVSRAAALFEGADVVLSRLLPAQHPYRREVERVRAVMQRAVTGGGGLR